MPEKKTTVIYNYVNDWMKEIILSVAPNDFDVHFVKLADDEQAEKHLPEADFLVPSGLTEHRASLLKRCKLVQPQGVGFDKINTDALKKAGIPLALTPEGTVIGVAEHTILLILSLFKQLIPVHQSMRGGEYDNLKWRPSCHFLNGSTLGIVGFGRIGRRVAHLAKAFESKTFYYDIYRASEAVENELAAQYQPFDDLITESDIVSVHTPLTDETRNQFTAEVFANMKPGSYFIITGRGQTYDMDALYEALKSGHLAGAGIDVFNPEPPPMDHPILQLPNIICTPHMATGTVEAHVAKAKAQFENFRRVLRGETPVNLVNI